MQRSHIASVYIIYILYIYNYICHTLIARGRGRLHRCDFCGPDSHVHLQCTACAKCRVEKEAIYTKGTLPQKRVRQRRESLTD